MFWTDRKKRHPRIGTHITLEDVEAENWIVSKSMSRIIPGVEGALLDHVKYYLEELGEPLEIKGFNCLFGSISASLAPIVEEALFFHSIVRKAQVFYKPYGTNPLVEFESVFNAKVTTGKKGSALVSEPKVMKMFSQFDKAIFAGDSKIKVVNSVSDLYNSNYCSSLELYVLNDSREPSKWNGLEMSGVKVL
jgi:hypothetical protein